jgi:hypothetical protein
MKFVKLDGKTILSAETSESYSHPKIPHSVLPNQLIKLDKETLMSY